VVTYFSLLRLILRVRTDRNGPEPLYSIWYARDARDARALAYPADWIERNGFNQSCKGAELSVIFHVSSKRYSGVKFHSFVIRN
jgi:hypothetical protein